MDHRYEELQGYIRQNGKIVPVTVIFNSRNPTDDDRQKAQEQIQQFCTQIGQQLIYQPNNRRAQNEQRRNQ
jgi:hypothetical protein